MTKRIMFVLALIGVASGLGFVLTGCETSSSGDTSKHSVRALLTLGAADNGSDWTIPQGSQLVISLETVTAPSTGYVWSVEANSSILRLASAPPTNALPGRVSSFTFGALRAGSTTLGLYYRRPGEPVGIQSFMMNVNVAD